VADGAVTSYTAPALFQVTSTARLATTTPSFTVTSAGKATAFTVT